MNSTLQTRKSNIVEVIETIEDEKVIDLLSGIMIGYQEKLKGSTVKHIAKPEELEYTEAVAKEKIKQAAFTLDGELYEIKRNLNKILFLLQEMEEDYYYELDVWKEEDRKKIINEYVKNSTYTQIIQDNAIAIERVLNSIKKASDTVKTA